MIHYSFEKGKFGGVVGTIYPFTTTLTGNIPSTAPWKQKVPAGFLRCDGSVVSADLYPALAKILGVGPDSFYRKENITLNPANDDGTGGQFQLPDIGSKFIRASGQGGSYNDLFATSNTGSQQRKVGVSVDVSSNLGTGSSVTATITYSGEFSVPSRNLSMSGNYSLTMETSTRTSAVSSDTILPHAHFSNTVSIEDPTNKRGASRVDAGGGYTAEDPYDVEAVESFVPSTGLNTADTVHDHLIQRTNITRSLLPTVPSYNVSVENISTDVILRVDDTFVMNDIQPRFILVEYLIKF
jgi:microcystin-dependent protein